MPIQNNSNSGTNKSNLNSSFKPSGILSTNTPARVTDIVLDENHPKFKEVGGYPGIGAILFEGANNIGIKGNNFAYPYDPHIKDYPLINETVIIVNIPGKAQNNSPRQLTPFYMKTAGIWNHPNHNAFINLFKDLKSPQQSSDLINEVENGDPLSSNLNPPEESLITSLNSPINPSQNTFVENPKIQPLLPFSGDFIMEGRYGQSIRFGSTAKSNSSLSNNWSDGNTTQNGDPILIIKNGQPLIDNPRGWIPTTENINNDRSSIYLTSTQKIPIGLSNENFKSFSNKPKTPSSFFNPQIILNSSKITINSKDDDILLTSQQNIGLLSNNNINLESLNMVLHTDNILKIGSNKATESVLLGDKTYNVLEKLIEQLINIAEITSTMERYLEGKNKQPDGEAQLISGTVISGLTKIKNEILPNIKSNKVKVE
tara:strand:+ start:115 stop:1401 length:1287 start_codon:yes stop_codon:yes gene_type:complete